jgi:hypothetical protein
VAQQEATVDLMAGAKDDKWRVPDCVSTDGGMAMNILVHKTKSDLSKTIYCSIVATAVFIFLLGATSHAAKMTQRTFASPDKAFDMLIAAVKSDDARQLAALFGPGAKDIFPADETANARARERFTKAYDEKHRLENRGAGKVILHVGDNDWPWPVPVVKKGNLWHFDTQAGVKEIKARRIGKNEVATVQVCLAYVDSQLEYARQHTANGIGEYAQQLASDPDKKNGLCWNEKDGEKQSLLGPLVVSASKKEMQSMMPPGMEPSPYHGYYYKILKSQGKDAPDGAYSYVVDGKMIGGFALVAYPAVYGATGITTFIVNKDGIVYQKDLGKYTEKIAEAMDSYNPDATWKKVD